MNKLYTKGIIDEPVYEIVDQIYDDDNRQLWACSCMVDGYETQQCEGYYYKVKNAEADAAKKVLMKSWKTTQAYSSFFQTGFDALKKQLIPPNKEPVKMNFGILAFA